MKHVIPSIKKLTALALIQPKESLPIGELTNVIRFDSKPYKITDCIQREELIETLKTYQLN